MTKNEKLAAVIIELQRRGKAVDPQVVERVTAQVGRRRFEELVTLNDHVAAMRS